VFANTLVTLSTVVLLLVHVGVLVLSPKIEVQDNVLVERSNPEENVN
jgi:hypothetical protein